MSEGYAAMMRQTESSRSFAPRADEGVRPYASKIKIKVKCVGQECPTHTSKEKVRRWIAGPCGSAE
jgi:hypothetical protein